MTDFIEATPARLERFRHLVGQDQIKGLLRKGYRLEFHNVVCKIKMGRKYANVDVGDSGKYMVELDTSRIYGIKGYGVIHRGHYFGTLDTIEAYDWSGYVGQRKEAATL